MGVEGSRRVLLVASSGGHLAQLQMIAPVFTADERRWATSAPVLADLGSDPVVHTYAPSTRSLKNLVRNLWLARRVVTSFRPELVVSTGAAPAVAFFVAARRAGAHTVFLEVYDRIDSATMTGRLVRRLSDAFLVQWPEQQRVYPDATVVGPVYDLDRQPAPDEPGRQSGPGHVSVLVTVGTDHHRFDRLVEWADRLADAPELAAIGLDGFVQRGTSEATPRWPSTRYLEADELAERLAGSDVVVCHGGPSTILEAIANGHRPIVVARDPEAGEHVDDHQQRFATHLAVQGVIDLVDSPQALAIAVAAAARNQRGPAQPLRAPVATLAAIESTVAGLIGPRRHAAAAPTTAGPAQPAITAVVATRDRPELLRRALTAIEASTYAGTIETVCVFDQSDPDPGLERRGGNRPVTVMTNVRTPGLAGARNTGVLAASGDWVAFCDDDDEWFPTKIGAQLDALAADPDARMATCGVAIRFQGEDHVRLPEPERLTFDGFLRDRMTEVHPSSFLIERRWLIDRVGLVDEDLPGSYAEDYDLLLRATRHGPITSVAEPLVRVHWHRSTFFRDRWTMIDSALGYLVGKFPEFAGEPKGLARIRGQQAFARAAAGERRSALGLVAETVRHNPLEPRIPVTLAVVAGVAPQKVLDVLHRFGRGL